MLLSVRVGLFVTAAQACTNILVSKGASKSGAVILAYNADEETLFGSLGHYPATKNNNENGQVFREIWDWDSSVYLGKIPEVDETYNVVGNANEHGLVIGETTFGGLPDLDGHGTGAIIDYGSLIWLTLQRAKTAREAIGVMDTLTQTYGYASDGESFSIADPNEIWLMEMISKGRERGSVWVARRVPDGYMTATANQARIRTFPVDRPDDCLYSKDVMTFAQSKGLYPQSGTIEYFSFSDTYDPVTFTAARLCEARVWNVFAPACKCMDSYLDYAIGTNLTNRMPLFVKPTNKLSVNATMNLMRTHGENTWFDNRGLTHKDAGAGPGNSPYRWRPLVWQSEGQSYVNERTVGVQQTGWTFVAETRAWLPDPIKALQWWAPDESSTAVRIPVWGGVTAVPAAYADKYGQMPMARASKYVEGDAFTMSMDSAFWVYNLVANLAYGERSHEVIPLVQTKLHEMQDQLFTRVREYETMAATYLQGGDRDNAMSIINEACVKLGTETVTEWRSFWMFLFARFRDGYTNKTPKQETCRPGQKSGCTFRPVPAAEESGYSPEWYARVVADNGAHYRVTSSASASLEAHKLYRLNKNRNTKTTKP